MPTTVAQIMTAPPDTVGLNATIAQAARQMRDSDVGNVLVTDGERLIGTITDRDIVIRAVAEGMTPETPVGHVCSDWDIATVTPDASVADAVAAMREKAVRRLPVVEGNRPVGVVSLGDLALEHDDDFALADISAAPGNE